MIPIVQIVVVLLVAGLLLWAVTQLPLAPPFPAIIRVVIVMAVVIWLLSAFGLLPASCWSARVR